MHIKQFADKTNKCRLNLTIRWAVPFTICGGALDWESHRKVNVHCSILGNGELDEAMLQKPPFNPMQHSCMCTLKCRASNYRGFLVGTC